MNFRAVRGPLSEGSEKKFSKLFHCAFFGLFGRRETGEFLIRLKKLTKQLNNLSCIVGWNGRVSIGDCSFFILTLWSG